MATPELVAQLRSLVDDTATPYEFQNHELSAQLDVAQQDVRKAAGQVWTIKASRLAGLVDVTEGASSRKLGSLYKQALEMASHFGASPAATDTGRTGRSGTRAIVRN